MGHNQPLVCGRERLNGSVRPILLFALAPEPEVESRIVGVHKLAVHLNSNYYRVDICSCTHEH